MKELTEAEKIIVAITKGLDKADLKDAYELGKKLMAEQNPKLVFPSTGYLIDEEGYVEIYNSAPLASKHGNMFYTKAEAEKEVLRRAARARCIEKIADCEDDNSRIYFKPGIWTSHGVAFKISERPPVEYQMVCKSRAHAESLAKDKQFCVDYKLYLGVSYER